MNPISEAVTFSGAGGDTLAARLDRPAGAPIAYALFAHCFTCSKDVRAATYIAKALVARGIAVLRFDFTGLGGSGGDFANSNFSSNVGDLVAAAGWLRREHEAPQLLVGHSLGGAAVVAAAAQIDEVVAVATVNAPSDPAHVLKQLGPARAEIEAKGELDVQLAGRPFRIRKQFLDDIAAAAILPAVAQLGRALMVMHAPRDTLVDVENAARLFVAAKHPKSFVSLDDADHLLSHREDAEYVGTVLAAWVGRYLRERAPAPAEASVEAPPEPGTVRVVEAGTGRFAQHVFAGRHRLAADEPESVDGGTDTGPSPYELLLAGLGACTAMTMRLYANLKKLPLERVSVTLKHDRIHAADCADCTTREGKLDRIERVVMIEGALDAAQRASLMAIADKCPVHRTLHGEIRIVTREAAPPA